MRISRIRVDGFKGLAGIDWRPRPGLNLVLGPNEAGKSSLAEFLEAMLFGVPGGAGADLFRPWKGASFGGGLELDCGRTLVTIERDFGSGDFRCDEVATTDGSHREPLAGQLRRGSSGALFDRYRELLRRHMGFFDDKLYRRSTYVPQSELVLGARDLGEATATLRSLASGGGSGYDLALEKLSERYFSLTSEKDGRRKPGVLDELRDEKAELTSLLHDSADTAKRVAKLRGALASAQEESTRLHQEARETQGLGEALRERAELLRRRSALAGADESDRERLGAAERAGSESLALERRLSSYVDLAAADERLPQLIAEAREARDHVRRLETHRESLSDGVPRAYPYVKVICAAAAGVLLGCAGLGAGLIADILALTVLGAAFGFAGLVSAAVILHFRRRGDAQAMVHRDSSRRASLELAKANNRFKAVTAELMTQTGGRVDFVGKAMDDVLRRYWERLELLARHKALDGNIADEQELKDLRARISDTVRELATIDERLERSDSELGVDRDDQNAEEQARKTAARSAELASLTDKCCDRVHALELELAALTSAETASVAAEERLEEVDYAIASSENRCRALRLARSELTASIQEFQESHLDRLADIASGILGALTVKHYKSVRLDPETLTPTVDCPERENVGRLQLSRGAQSALYLALRLAMGKLISGGRELPLILDDPLVDLDDQRRAASLELLSGLGEETQVLLLSFDRRLADCGAPVLELERSAGR